MSRFIKLMRKNTTVIVFIIACVLLSALGYLVIWLMRM